MTTKETIWNLKQEIHDLSHELKAFSYENRDREDWARFYGATDSIDDMGTALSQFRGLVRTPSLLERIGFLQALVIQQHAVEAISKSIKLDWNVYKDERLVKVRNIRDRVAGHPVWSEKGKNHKHARSSVMQILHDVDKSGFYVVMYFDERTEREFVSYEEFEALNEAGLCTQLRKIISQMHKMECEHDKSRASEA